MIKIADNPIVREQIKRDAGTTGVAQLDAIGGAPDDQSNAGSSVELPEPAREMSLQSGRYYVVNQKK